MKINVVRPDELSDDLISAWVALQCADRTVDSPFFRPEFTQLVAQVRDDVEVAVLEEAGEVVGFFPYQRGRGNVGRPVGGRMSDFQGVVLKAGVELDPMALVRGCRLSSWHFDHLIATQPAFVPYCWHSRPSPFIDTSQGFEAYQKERREAGGLTLQKMGRKLRKLEREVGPARCDVITSDEQVLDTLIRWKMDQYRANNVVNVFSFGWTVELLRLLLTKTDDAFRGFMSAWYVNDELAAVHFGIRTHHVLHSWFPAYRTDLYRHSPGSQLLIEVIKAAHPLGIERIDLGAGDEEYKASFLSGATTVTTGAVDSRPGAQTMQRFWHHTKRLVKESPFRGPATVPWRLIRHMRDQVLFR